MKTMKMLAKKQPNNSSLLSEKQCKTEVSIKLKNISKLIFVESDDQNSEDEQARAKLGQTFHSSRRNNQTDLDLHQKRPFSKDFKAESKMLKPSLMNEQTQNIQDYEEIINCTFIQPSKSTTLSNNKKASKVATKQQNLFFEELVEKRDRLITQRFHRRELPKPSLSEKLQAKEASAQIKDQKKAGKDQGKQIMIPKMQVANLCFQYSDEEPEGAQNHKKESTKKDLKQALATQKQLEQTAEKQISEMRNPIKETTQAFEQKQEIKEHVNIEKDFQNLELCERSMYLQQILENWSFDQARIITLMNTPILPNTKQSFQIEVYSSFASKYYLLWLEMGQKKRLLMKAVKLIQLNKTTFQFYTMDPKLLQYLQTCTMTSNIDRSLFNMYRVDHNTNKKRLIGTYNNSYNIKNCKMIILYHPKVNQNNECSKFQDYQINKDLRMVFRENQSHEVDYVMTTKMDLGKKLKLMSYYNLKASQKSMEFKNSRGNMQVIIGKKQSKKYKIIAAPGLTPVQVFGLTIVQIQS